MNDRIRSVLDKYLISEDEFDIIKAKSEISGEFTDGSFETWFEERFENNLVAITKEEYAQMCVSALKILSNVAATDYGSSRQRDMGQLWADTTRGYLGEMAFLIFLRKHWNIESPVQ